MKRCLSRVWAAFCCAALLATCSVHAVDILTIHSPLELQVNQRNQENQAKVTISGVIKGAADIIEARANLSAETRHGKSVGWTLIAKSDEIDKGKFSGKISLAAGGWYTLTIRARLGKDVVAETKIAKVGVGEVFITAGQSNSANFGKPKQEAQDDRVVYFNGKNFVPAKDPIPGGCGGNGSVWPILGDHIARSQQVPVCFRSASLTWTEVKNWMPHVTFKKLRLHENLVKCVGEFEKNGIRAVLWHQGESDSLAKTPAETYFKRLKTIIEALNKEAGCEIPWFVAQASFHPGSKEAEEKEVARGQQLLWERGVARKGPVTDDLLGEKYRSDGVHFNQLGLTTHGARWFRALSAEIYEKTLVGTSESRAVADSPRENSAQDANSGSMIKPFKTMSRKLFPFVKGKALDIVKSGFSAGDGYGEVWIRDYNTFIELSAEVFEAKVLRENLLVFFKMQGDDGNILDGFIPKDKVSGQGYEYIYSEMEPRYAGHKNTVETDQESSLIQAVYKYVQLTGDKEFLNSSVGDKTVAERLEWALSFLMNHRYNKKHGLIWGATTADWGDVQPEHKWGVFITDDTHYAIDIYDNAMFLIALDNFMELIPAKKKKWQPVRNQIADNVRKHLWDEENLKFIPHVYLNGSPFPEDFNESEIYYHGGTALAIEANLLSKEEIKISLEKMLANVKASGAGSIGLTLYPVYPEGFYKNKSMYPHGYQNGGDWTWFGGRMIQQLIRNGFVEEAYQQIYPMVKRVKDNDGFFEWYTVDNKPKGSGTFRGSAGVLYKAILMFEELENKE